MADASGASILAKKKQGARLFEERLSDVTGQVERRLDDVFGAMPAGPVTEAMAHACRGGKRIRALLVMESAHLHGIPDDVSVGAAAAVEAAHAYSLVHDDLPAMDDDDMRRGQPTVHVKWDEATAVLAGDGLQALAFELLAGLQVDAGVRVGLIGGLARAAGAAGMVRGQAMDIAAESARPAYGQKLVEETQALKTGALIEWAACTGPVMAAADPAPMAAYAAALGRAFQIADDILDVEGDAETAGKRVGKDAAAGKATFVSLMGLAGARQLAKVKIAEACVMLKPYGDAAECLREAARFVIARQS